MADYQLLNGGGVLRAADGAAIPPDTRNADWRRYLAWVAAGNTADPIPQPAPRAKRIVDVLEGLPVARKKALLTTIGADPTLLD